MASPAWLWHPTGGKVLYPDLTPELSTTLAREGWVDSPDKLSKPLAEEKSADPAPSKDDAKITTGSGRVLSKDTMDDFKAGGQILSSAQALGRLSLLFDADGDPVHGDLSDDDLAEIVNDMSREELLAALSQAGADERPGAPSYLCRDVLLAALRPDVFSADEPEEINSNAKVSGAVEDNKPTDDLSAKTTGDGATTEKTDAEKDALQTEQAADPTSEGGKAFAPAAVPNDQSRPHDAAVGTQGTAPAALPDTGPLANDVAPALLAQASAEQKKEWLANATKADLHFQLDSREIVYKARDGRDDLVALLSPALTPKE